MPLTTANENQDNLDVSVRKLKQVTVISGQTVVRGEVMQLTGQRTAATAVAGSNTGNGTVSGETALDTASVGTYTLVCTAEVGDAGTFSVQTPDGSFLPDLTVAVAYSNQIGLTIADGAEDFDTGDSFTVLVTSGLGKQTSFATGGVPSTVMYDAVDASGGDVVGWAYRDADIKATEVDFGTGTDAEVRTALDGINIFLMD